jgi:hypothetical protein
MDQEIMVRTKRHFKVDCIRDGKLLWTEEFDNTNISVGLTYYVGAALLATTPITSWFIGLKSSSGNISAGDTLASHTWTESTAYSDSTRVAWTGVAGSAGSADNSGSPAVFHINGSVTIYGAFLCSQSNKASTTGTLLGVGDFSQSRTVISGDILNVTITCSVS